MNNFRRKLNELFLYIGCSNCECDEGGALSSCQVPQCKPNHDLLIEETSCDARGLKCCRMTCDGPGTMCLPDNAPNADLGQKSCKEGYKCVTAPSRLKRRLLISWCASGGFSRENSSEFSPFLHVNTVNCRSQCMTFEPLHRRMGFTGFINEGA